MEKVSATTWKIGIASLWCTAFVVAFVATTPRPWTLAIIGMGLGCLAGYVRSRAIGAGKLSRTADASTWLCGIGLMVLAMAIAEDMFVSAWAASFAGYLLLDCLYSLASNRKKQVSSGVAADDMQERDLWQ